MRRASLSGITAFAIRHPWRVVGAWAAALVVAIALIVTLLGSALANDARPTNHPESIRGFDRVDQAFPHLREVDELVVVRATGPHGSLNDDRTQAALRRLLAEGTKLPVRIAVPGAVDPPTSMTHPTTPAEVRAAIAALPRSRDGRAVLVPVTVLHDVDDTVDDLVDLVDRVDRTGGVVVSVTGVDVMAHDQLELSNSDLESGELKFGLPVALVVLLGVFGAVVGGLVPLALALLSIVCAIAMVAVIGQAWPVSFFAINMISGMGLALGIDYTLFLLSRFREEREGGIERDAAIARVGSTASRAVLFSGVTYVVALVGMLMVQTTIMRSLALGAVLVGVVAVLAALTLTPALLRILGDRVNAGRVPIVGARAQSVARSSGLWERIARTVMRRPAAWGGAVAVLLLVLALPAFGLRSGAAGVSTLPARLPSVRGYRELQRSFPDASASPLRVVLTGDFDSSAQTGALQRVAAKLGERRLLDAGSVTISRDHHTAAIYVPLAGDALAPGAVRALRDVRAHLLPAAIADAHLRVDHRYVTGFTAFNVDYFDVMSRWMPIVFAFVLGLSFVLLTVVFRSIVVALKAIVLNLLSVGAAYGLMVYVFTHAWSARLFGFVHVDVIEAWVPLFLFSVLFGLSMDYHMFLLTRIRERWVATGDTREAVAHGVGSTGRLITGAALIIIAVFVGFARGELVMFQQMGFGIAAALLIDATLVRSVLLPASMTLLGRTNWYLPRWLAWLPEVQVERETRPT